MTPTIAKTTQNHIYLISCFYALALAGILVLSPLSETLAATQGTLGASSTGTVNISVKKDARVKIGNLDDLTATSWEEGNGDITMTDDVCIYSTRAMGGYKIAPFGSGNSNSFTLENNGNFLPYELLWDDGGEGNLGTAAVALSANNLSTAFKNASTSSPNCSNGGNARLAVRIAAPAMSSAVDGTYTGVLTLIVSPS